MRVARFVVLYSQGLAWVGTALLSAVLAAHSDHTEALYLSAVVHGRAGRAGEAIDALNRALNAALVTGEVRERLAIEGAEPQPTTPEEYAAIIDRELTMWSDLVKAVGIKPE